MSNQQEFAFLDCPCGRNLTTALSALSDVQDVAGSEEDESMVERVDQSKQIIIEVMEDKRKKEEAT